MISTMTRGSLREERNRLNVLTFHFNPTTLSFQRTVTFNREANQSSREDPPSRFTGVRPTSLKLKLLFDAVGKAGGRGVQPEIDRLVSWTTVPEGATGANAAPPRLVFAWGRLSLNGRETFPCHLERLNVTCELFDRQGVPLRATVDLTLKSVTDAPAPTNPTSVTRRSQRRQVLRPGQDLQAVAHAEYGDPGVWRAIAEVNGIDDPTRLRPGTELLLPDRTELVARHG